MRAATQIPFLNLALTEMSLYTWPRLPFTALEGYNQSMKGLVPRMVMVTLAVGIGIYCSRDVWRRYASERRQADQATAEMRIAEIHKAELQREKADLESAAGRERLARERGWKKPGETPL